MTGRPKRLKPSDPKFPRGSNGFHKLKCPSCQSDRIETQCMSVSPERDPNTKMCRDCMYCWRQEFKAKHHVEATVSFETIKAEYLKDRT